MVKSHRSKRHHKKHRGGEGEPADNNSVLNMDEPTTAMPETATPANEMAPTATQAPAEEEKKGWFSSLFGGSKTKRVRFRMARKSTRKHKSTKRSSAKRSSAKRSTRKRKSSNKKRKGSSRK